MCALKHDEMVLLVACESCSLFVPQRPNTDWTEYKG